MGNCLSNKKKLHNDKDKDKSLNESYRKLSKGYSDRGSIIE